MNHLSEEDTERLHRMLELGIILKSHWRDNYSIDALAKQFGVHRNTISNHRQVVLCDPDLEALDA